MTNLILLAIGAAGAGFMFGALLVHWSYRPVRMEQAPHEANTTRELGCTPEYNAGDEVLVSVPGGNTKRLTITHIHECDDLAGRILMSADEFIPVDWIMGRIRS